MSANFQRLFRHSLELVPKETCSFELFVIFGDGWILEMLCGWKLTWFRTFSTLLLECTPSHGAEANSIARVRSGWKSFRILLPLLASCVISLETKGRSYAACVRSVMVDGSLFLRSTSVMSRIFNQCLNSSDDLPSFKLTSHINLIIILSALDILVISSALRWFGHVMRMDAGNPTSACRHVVVEGNREQIRPKKT